MEWTDALIIVGIMLWSGIVGYYAITDIKDKH